MSLNSYKNTLKSKPDDPLENLPKKTWNFIRVGHVKWNSPSDDNDITTAIRYQITNTSSSSTLINSSLDLYVLLFNTFLIKAAIQSLEFSPTSYNVQHIRTPTMGLLRLSVSLALASLVVSASYSTDWKSVKMNNNFRSYFPGNLNTFLPPLLTCGSTRLRHPRPGAQRNKTSNNPIRVQCVANNSERYHEQRLVFQTHRTTNNRTPSNFSRSPSTRRRTFEPFRSIEVKRDRTRGIR